MSSPAGRKLQLKKSKVTTVSDEMLLSVVGGTADLQQIYPDTGLGMGGQSSPTATTTPTLTPCACPGNSQTPYGCDTNATCSPTRCITCATVCTCLGGCS